MKAIDAIDDSQWDLLIRDVAENFDELSISRGFQYFKQGRVLELTEPSPRILEAVVRGTERYRVEINLDFFTVSSCNCPVQHACKHMMAVLLYYADEMGRSYRALANAKNTIPPAFKPYQPGAPTRKTSKKAEEQAALLSRRMEQNRLVPTMSVTEWHRLFEERTSHLHRNIRNEQYVSESMKAIFQPDPGLSPIMNRLYRQNARFFTLKKLMTPIHPGHTPSYFGYHTQQALVELRDVILREMKKEGTGAEPGDDPILKLRIQETIDFLREQMLSDGHAQEYFQVLYLAFLQDFVRPLGNAKALYAEELNRLESIEKEQGSEYRRYPGLLSRSWLHYWMREDAEAWALLRRLDDELGLRSHDHWRFLNDLGSAKDWKRLLEWLVETGSLLDTRSYDVYSSQWEVVVDELPEAEERMWSTLADLLPHSGKIYEEKLYEYGKWERWMEYLLSAGYDPENFHSNDLKTVEKEAPEVLLPFYHQSIERYVASKNRENYRTAVKLLKQLSKLYAGLKQTERWDRFFDAFTERHSRLRALNEELKKGKLIT